MGPQSILAWIDYDAAERERMRRILALFREREARDELGFGTVRDSIADHLFPGTSTIQTRLRYMLFVPWLYKHLESTRVASSHMAAQLRSGEQRLMDALLQAEDTAGVFGRVAREGLKRFPSEVYWAGLGQWGIRRIPGSQDSYHLAIDGINRLRASRTRNHDGGWEADERTVTWDPDLPPTPSQFPESATLTLTRAEADYLVDRVSLEHPDSLLVHLMRERHDVPAEFPWEHPDRARFATGLAHLVEHGRLFADLVKGAADLYNLLLCQLRQDQERLAQHVTELQQWQRTLDLRGIQHWDLNDFWLTIQHDAHQISWATRRFVEVWRDLVLSTQGRIEDSGSARQLIEQREATLKGAQSRFRNIAARLRWSGASGRGRLAYRWGIVRTLLQDLANAE